jgi:hypothetical protein
MITQKATANCHVRLEWRHDGRTGARTTDLNWLRNARNPYTGTLFSGRDTNVTFFTPSGEWTWADGKLWTPNIPGVYGDHWIGCEKLEDVLETITESLDGKPVAEIYDNA